MRREPYEQQVDDYWGYWCPRNGYYPPQSQPETLGSILRGWGWADWLIGAGVALVVGFVAIFLLYLFIDTIGIIGFLFLVAAVCGTVLVLAKEDGQEGA